jgi:hypothetical protein
MCWSVLRLNDRYEYPSSLGYLRLVLSPVMPGDQMSLAWGSCPARVGVLDGRVIFDVLNLWFIILDI